jgi:hypothetical protein
MRENGGLSILHPTHRDNTAMNGAPEMVLV